MNQRRYHELRVIAEKSELDTRIFTLKQFFNNPLFEKVDVDERVRLKQQANWMDNYADVLKQRIAAFPPIVGSINGDNPGPRGHEKVTYLNPELAGQAVFKEEVPIGAKPINDVDTFAMMIDHWHAQCMERGNRVLEIPEGTTIEVEDQKTPGQTLEMDLNGPYLQVFRVGVMTVLHLFKDLPFGASIEEAPANDPAAS